MTMELELDLGQEFTPSQTLKVSPRLVAANYILELSSQELQQQIATELSENPALELVEIPTCRVCGTELQGSICPRCIQHQKSGGSSVLGPDSRGYSYDEPDSRNRGADDDEFDPLTRVASEQTLAEKLLMEMGAALPDEDMPIAEYLVGSLDEKGYLAIKVDDVAYELDVPVDKVRAVLRVLQAQEPVGIGARNLRECLAIQIAHLEERGLSHPHALEIVTQFLTELGEHKFGRIAHELKISQQEVADVWEFVKTKLNPHPAHGFSSTNASDRDTRAMYIVPDVVITKTADGFDVEVVESRRFVLRVNPMYTRLSADLHRSSANMNAEEKRHVQQYVGRAKLFIANINQRRQTLYNITRCLVEQQKEKGIHIARRTVAKYRMQLAILPSSLR